jgi:hypothetical protein
VFLQPVQRIFYREWKRMTSGDLNGSAAHLHGRAQDVPAAKNHSGSRPSVSEANSLLYSGAVALDPVLLGVAQGLSTLFPLVARPDAPLPDDRAPTDADPAREGSDLRCRQSTERSSRGNEMRSTIREDQRKMNANVLLSRSNVRIR